MTLKEFKKLQNLCSMCMFDNKTCKSETIIKGLDIFPDLKGSDLDKVINCDLFEIE